MPKSQLKGSEHGAVQGRNLGRGGQGAASVWLVQKRQVLPGQMGGDAEGGGWSGQAAGRGKLPAAH